MRYGNLATSTADATIVVVGARLGTRSVFAAKVEIVAEEIARVYAPVEREIAIAAIGAVAGFVAVIVA